MNDAGFRTENGTMARSQLQLFANTFAPPWVCLGMVLVWLSTTSCSRWLESTPTAAPSASAVPPIAPSAAQTASCQLSRFGQTQPACQLPPSLPSPIPVTRSSATDWALNMGIGYVGPLTTTTPQPSAYRRVGFIDDRWLQGVILPLYRQPIPEAVPKAWLVCGWLILNQPRNPSPQVWQSTLFYPGYNGFGFLVLAQRGEWLRVQYGAANALGDGTAWVRVAELGWGTVPLAFVSWRDRYQSLMQDPTRISSDRTKNWGFLWFRDYGDASSARSVSHPLRAQPTAKAKVVAWIRGDYAMLPLEVRDEWMYVRVYQPSNYCTDAPSHQIHQGWIRWMDQQTGNQLAEPYKGC